MSEFPKDERNYYYSKTKGGNKKKVPTLKKLKHDQSQSVLMRDFRPLSGPVKSVEEEMDLIDLNADDSTEDREEEQRPLPTWSQSDMKAEELVLSIIRNILCAKAVTIEELYPLVMKEMEKMHLDKLDITNPELYEFKEVKDLEDYMRARSLLFRTDTQTNLWSNLPLGYGMHVAMLANYILRKSSDWITVETTVREFEKEMLLGQVDDWRVTDECRLVIEEVDNVSTRETIMHLIKQHPGIFEIRQSAELDIEVAVSQTAREIASVIRYECQPKLLLDRQFNRIDFSRVYKYEAVIQKKSHSGHATAMITSGPYVGKSLVIYSNHIDDGDIAPWEHIIMEIGMQIQGLMHPTAAMAQPFRASTMDHKREKHNILNNPRIQYDMEANGINIDELDFIRAVRQIVEESNGPTYLADLKIKLNRLRVPSLHCESLEWLYEYLDQRREIYEIIEEKEAKLEEYEVLVIITEEEIDEYLCPSTL